MFRVALVIFRSTLGQPSQLSNCPSLYETLEVLRHIPPEILQEDFLTHEVCNCHFYNSEKFFSVSITAAIIFSY